MPQKTVKITFAIFILSISSFLLLSFVLPGHSYTIIKELLKTPISATQLITASINQLTGTNTQTAQTRNILILGVPGEPNNAPYLTDTIMVARITEDIDNKILIAAIAIPRDLLVENNGFWQRINALYVNGRATSHNQGVENIKNKVAEITGLDIQKYALIDLTAVKELVNQINGINVMIPQDIYDPRFPGPGSSYETFEIKKGWRYLDGANALRYVRTRNNPEGDFGRMKRQIQVLRALKDKIFSISPFFHLPTFLKILKTLNDHVETDLKALEIVHLWNLSKQMEKNNIKHIIIDTAPEKNLLQGAKVMLGNQEASVMAPIAGIEEYGEIQKYIRKNIEY